MDVNGVWVGWGLGDNSGHDFTVRDAKSYMRRMYASYCSDLADTNLFDQAMQDHVEQMQQRLAAGGQLTWGQFILGVLDITTQYAMGFKHKPLPVFITVEGHMSNMWAGPVADTATQLMAEGICVHQPTGYKNGDIPFNNKDGVSELQENFALRSGTGNVYLGAYSQGVIVLHDWLAQYGVSSRIKGILMYGNPCRQAGSVAEWARPWVERPELHGLDPYKRFGKTVILDGVVPHVDVWREYDIFAQNGDDEEGQMKAAVYEAVARGDFFSNPISLASLIFKLFSNFSMTYILGFIYEVMMASGSGIKFLADNPNPHYAPYDITGGKNWMRGVIKNG